MPSASIVAMVSRRDSPFFTLLEATANERTSALRRFAAVSKLSRVRVDSSKKSEATTRPFRAGTFLILRRFTSTKDSAVSRTSTIASFDNSSSERRLRPRMDAITTVPSYRSIRPRGWRRWLHPGTSGDSCRRSRDGSAVRGGRGRPIRPVARRAAGPNRTGR